MNPTMLEMLEMERDKKIENVALWLKDLRSEAAAIGEEIKALQHRKKVAENKVESLKQYLQYALDGDTFSTSKVAVSYRMSERVEVLDMLQIDGKYLKLRPPEVDKTAIKKAIKAGEDVDGAIIVPISNIQIK